MTQHQRRKLVRQQDVAILVDYARTISVAVDKEAHARAFRGDDFLALVRPRVAGLGMESTKILARVSVNLCHLAAQPPQCLCEHTRASPVHGVNHNAEAGGRNGRAVHECDKIV